VCFQGGQLVDLIGWERSFQIVARVSPEPDCYEYGMIMSRYLEWATGCERIRLMC
jgi:hypothetical protein